MTSKAVVYCYHCIPTGKKYIGQTVNEASRKRAHKWNIENTDMSFAWYNAVRKYGWDSFIYGVIEYTDKEQLNARESYWIEYYNTLREGGYNMTSGGRQCMIVSEEVRKKISDKGKGRIVKQSTRNKLRDKAMGRVHKEETKRKIANNKASTYEVEYITGEVEVVKNMTQYCKERGYHRGCIVRLIANKLNRYKDIVSIIKLS